MRYFHSILSSIGIPTYHRLLISKEGTRSRRGCGYNNMIEPLILSRTIAGSIGTYLVTYIYIYICRSAVRKGEKRHQTETFVN